MPYASTDDPDALRRQIHYTRRRAEGLERLASLNTGQLRTWLQEAADLEAHLVGVLEKHLAWLHARTATARAILRDQPTRQKHPRQGRHRDQRPLPQPHPLEGWLRQAKQ